MLLHILFRMLPSCLTCLGMTTPSTHSHQSSPPRLKTLPLLHHANMANNHVPSTTPTPLNSPHSSPSSPLSLHSTPQDSPHRLSNSNPNLLCLVIPIQIPPPHLRDLDNSSPLSDSNYHHLLDLYETYLHYPTKHSG